ncbi:MAG: AMP-binding protein [Paludibacteraceae bacterium]|nr:AMP-binding protein [Paludibacteraceae bacterium]
MLSDPEWNFVSIYERSFRTNWDLEAVSDYGTSNTMTYRMLAEQIAKLHLLYRMCSIEKNDRIAVMGRNNTNWVSVYLSTILYGATIVPILQDFKANDALHIINHSEAKLLFVSDIIWEGLDLEQMDEVEGAYSLADFKLLGTRLTGSGFRKSDFSWDAVESAFKKQYPNGMRPEDVTYAKRSNSEIASINYTSGTTGFSKGVLTPCNALAGNVKLGFESGLIFPGCRHVAFLPLAHAYGCAFDLLACLAAGGHTHLIGRTPSPKVLLQAFAEVKPTVILSVPLVLEKIYKKLIVPQITKRPVSWVLRVPFLDEMVYKKIRETLVEAFGGCFREVIIGGAPLNPEVEQFLHKIKFPLTVGYGMTECAPLIAYTPATEFRALSCGQALKGLMEARIGHPDANGVGEIEVRGENVMAGYYKNKEATKKVFTKDGWLRTGDLGVIDKDGFIFIKGRNKTMMLGPSGQNIYPEEIEAKLNNMPFVLESLVIQNDGKLVALVCPNFEDVDAEGMTREQVDEQMEVNRKAINEQLANYEQIAKMKLYPHEFEKTPKKSIKRFLYTSLAE